MTLHFTKQLKAQVLALVVLASLCASLVPLQASAALSGPVCTVTLTSQAGDNNAVATFVHGAWTAISGATWIWSDALVTDTTVEQTKTFTKTFVWSGGVFDANLEIASDNSYSVVLNGDVVASASSASDNHSSTDTISVSSAIVQGENTLSFTVTNLATPTDTNPENNPAGLIYKLVARGTSETCDEMPTTTISGKKWNDVNGNGVREEGDNGLDGVTITITDGDEFSDSTLTTDGGRYSFTGLPIGRTFTVCEMAPLGYVQTHPTVADERDYMVSCEANGNGYEITTEAGSGEVVIVDGPTETYDFGNYSRDAQDTYELFGFVWDDINENDIIVAEEEPVLEGWTVKATRVTEGDESPEEYTDVTDANGRYSINVPVGTWRISQLTESGWVQLSTADGDGTYVVTVFAIEDAEAISSLLNWFVGTAHAATVGSRGPFNFGNDFVEGGSKTGSKRKNDDSSSSSSNEGDSSSSSNNEAPTGQVLGAATSVLPVGAPKTGGGGTSDVSATLLAIVGTNRKIKNA